MTQEHPITPPPELIKQWWDNTHGAFYEFEAVATQAARWGADQQLEMDATWVALQTSNQMSSKRLIAEMRPKPPSLKKLALATLDDAILRGDCITISDALPILRRALEQLDD
jgi:hypothetical protein